MYGLRQAPKLWQEHFAEVMTSKLGFRGCKSDPNLYCHESGKLYVLAYVDDLSVVGTDEMRKDFMSRLSEEVLLKETGQLVPGTEHTFLGSEDCDTLVIRLMCACHKHTLVRFWMCME